MRSKKYKAVRELIDKKKLYTLDEAVALVLKTSTTKFDSSIDIAVKLNLDTTRAEQQLRGTIALPHYFGKQIRIMAITDELDKASAKELGVHDFGGKEKIEEIKNGAINFDLIITTPKFMPELSKLGKVLGPRGLMPNPKTGTVVTDIKKAILEFKKGKMNYRTDTYGNIHMVIGKCSAKANQIIENINALIDFLKSKRPSTVKGEYIQSVYLSTTMGPAIKVSIN